MYSTREDWEKRRCDKWYIQVLYGIREPWIAVGISYNSKEDYLISRATSSQLADFVIKQKGADTLVDDKVTIDDKKAWQEYMKYLDKYF